MKVVALDPGPSFGIAVWDGQNHVAYQYMGGLFAAISRLKTFIQPGVHVVVEKFVITSSTPKKDLHAAYTTLYIIGAAQVAAQELGCSVSLQTPGQRDWAVPFLPALGWHRTGTQVGQPDADDANAASAHLLKHLVDARQLPLALLTKIIDTELT